MDFKFKEVKVGTKEITKQIESYEFQVRAIAWQILISLSITLGVFFLGAGNYTLFFVGLLAGLAFFAIVVLDYRRVKLSIISRERGLNTAELKRFRDLMHRRRYEDAIELLNHIAGITPVQKTEFIRTIRLSKILEDLMADKRINFGELKMMAKSSGFVLRKDFYKMNIEDLATLVKTVEKTKAKN